MATAAGSDAQTREAAGYAVKWLRREPAIYTAEVSAQSDATILNGLWTLNSGHAG